MITNLCHQLDQNHFIQARKDLRIHQIMDFKLHKTHRKLQLFLYRFRYLRQLLLILTV